MGGQLNNARTEMKHVQEIVAKTMAPIATPTRSMPSGHEDVARRLVEHLDDFQDDDYLRYVGREVAEAINERA